MQMETWRRDEYWMKGHKLEGKSGDFLSFAHTQMTVCVMANIRARTPKQLFASWQTNQKKNLKGQVKGRHQGAVYSPSSPSQ